MLKAERMRNGRRMNISSSEVMLRRNDPLSIYSVDLPKPLPQVAS